MKRALVTLGILAPLLSACGAAGGLADAEGGHYATCFDPCQPHEAVAPRFSRAMTTAANVDEPD